MGDQKDVKQFPDLSNKLAAPTKKSLFERQKAEAEAKRLKEEAETAAVYEDFVKSFDDDEQTDTLLNSSHSRASGGLPTGPRGGGTSGPGKRHFVSSGLRQASGPGSLGPRPPSLSKKRTWEESQPQSGRGERGLFTFDDQRPAKRDAPFSTSDDEGERLARDQDEEKAASRPTLQLLSLPPGFSPAAIKSLISPHLPVEAVRVMPTSRPNNAGSGRKSASAIVTLKAETPASEIDAAVTTLQHRYLGWGFYLAISRHLSSSALGSGITAATALQSSSSSLPFGAKQVVRDTGRQYGRAPPSDFHKGGYAPPSSYDPQGPNRLPPPTRVHVTPPMSIKELRLIHKTAEAVLTHGPEFEALLMTRPEVQREERWAWIWDARSTGGVWYRWRLWEVITGTYAQRERDRNSRFSSAANYRVFEDTAPWLEPEDDLPFEFTTDLGDVVSDADYDSSDEDDSDDEAGARKRQRRAGGREADGPPPPESLTADNPDETAYLNPLQRAKLTHLLARLPSSTAKLRKGDVARVTAFAIAHAGAGAEEVVDMLAANVLRPLNTTSASKELPLDDSDSEAANSPAPPPPPPSDSPDAKPDHSPSQLIALYLISDILSASSTSGVRHAWKYRALLETALTRHNVFGCLGGLDKGQRWGRLRADKWRRSVTAVLTLWEGWCVFDGKVHESFVEAFARAGREAEEESERKAREADEKAAREKGRWKSVEARRAQEARDEAARAAPAPANGAEAEKPVLDDVDGEPLDDVDGEPLDDVDGEPLDDVDGEPLNDGPVNEPDEQPANSLPAADGPTTKANGNGNGNVASEQQQQSSPAATAAALAKRQRPRAVDMFADSDGE